MEIVESLKKFKQRFGEAERVGDFFDRVRRCTDRNVCQVRDANRRSCLRTFEIGHDKTQQIGGDYRRLLKFSSHSQSAYVSEIFNKMKNEFKNVATILTIYDDYALSICLVGMLDQTLRPELWVTNILYLALY